MIPNKSSFKFQELTPITGVKPYVIRYWETEFPEISPIISDSGHKMYARKDLEAIFKIKKFLFEDKMSIPEAKARISAVMIDAPVEVDVSIHSQVNDSELRQSILDGLELIKQLKAKRNW
jgi:DNA-binding transcriptional MerR regulator